MMKWILALMLSLAVTGCVSRSTARLREQAAFLAGQNQALQQQAQKEAQSPGVTVLGSVQSHHVPWVAGLTLAQAVATAEYVGKESPKQIIITRHGEDATLDAGALLAGRNVPLEAGDTIELR